jgi:hypothetical protein
MQSAQGLTEIADELIHGDFVRIWQTPDGLLYCPTHLIAMVHYLREMEPRYIDTREKLTTLTNILNREAIDPKRKAMVDEALLQVFGIPGTSSLSVVFCREKNLRNLESLIFRLDACVLKLERT